MPLSTGTRLGAYEIMAPLGAGGMGEVYRARDTKLSSQAPRPASSGHSATILAVNSLTREVIVEALGLLADRLAPDAPRVDMIVVGGAAMVLLFNPTSFPGAR